MSTGDQRTLRDTGPAGSTLALTAGGAVVQQGRAIVIQCSVAGNVVLKFPDSTTITLAAQANTLYELNWAIVQVVSATATATYNNLY